MGTDPDAVDIGLQRGHPDAQLAEEPGGDVQVVDRVEAADYEDEEQRPDQLHGSLKTTVDRGCRASCCCSRGSILCLCRVGNAKRGLDQCFLNALFC